MADFQKESNEQQLRANEMVKNLITRILGREEEFTVVIRRAVMKRFNKDSSLIMVPPLEVMF